MTPRRRFARASIALAVCLLLTPVVADAVTGPGESELGPGTVTQAADGETVVSVQGWVIDGETSVKKPARLVAADPRARTEWVYDGDGASWFYDVDPLPNGNLLVVSPDRNGTLVYELDPESRERVWSRRLPIRDTHDVDRLSDGRLVVAAMRESDGQTSRDRVFVYDPTTNETTWEWYFRDHFSAETDGGIDEDWTHVNDVDPIGDGRLLLSPRNFDQVLVVDRTTGDIVMRLGSDNRYDTLAEQHTPDYLVSDEGTPTRLVADSGNDRVVECAYEDRETSETSQADGEAVDGEWVRVWSLAGSLNWPRDADRLPNGNTLITDSLNHRVIEVTPEGEVVWEYYATWGPYDAERVAHGDGSHGPTMRDLGVSGTYAVSGGAGIAPGGRDDVPTILRRTAAGTPLGGPADALATRWAHVVPWIRPVWLSGRALASGLVAGLVLLGWGLVEAVVARHRIAGGLRAALGSLTGSS